MQHHLEPLELPAIARRDRMAQDGHVRAHVEDVGDEDEQVQIGEHESERLAAPPQQVLAQRLLRLRLCGPILDCAPLGRAGARG